MHSNTAALRKPSILHEASRILNEEGLKAFWKGNLVTIAHRLPYSSVNFYAYEHYKKPVVWLESLLLLPLIHLILLELVSLLRQM
jgi:hypothetical protein